MVSAAAIVSYVSAPLCKGGPSGNRFEKGTVASGMCFLSAKPSPGSATT